MKSLMKEKIYEIRDYTIEEKLFDEYVYWAKNYFIPFAKKRIDIIDFSVDEGIDAEVSGTNPVVSENGQPNITWIAKYNDKKLQIRKQAQPIFINFLLFIKLLS